MPPSLMIHNYSLRSTLPSRECLIQHAPRAHSLSLVIILNHQPLIPRWLWLLCRLIEVQGLAVCLSPAQSDVNLSSRRHRLRKLKAWLQLVLSYSSTSGCPHFGIVSLPFIQLDGKRAASPGPNSAMCENMHQGIEDSKVDSRGISEPNDFDRQCVNTLHTAYEDAEPEDLNTAEKDNLARFSASDFNPLQLLRNLTHETVPLTDRIFTDVAS